MIGTISYSSIDVYQTSCVSGLYQTSINFKSSQCGSDLSVSHRFKEILHFTNITISIIVFFVSRPTDIRHNSLPTTPSSITTIAKRFRNLHPPLHFQRIANLHLPGIFRSFQPGGERFNNSFKQKHPGNHTNYDPQQCVNVILNTY